MDLVRDENTIGIGKCLQSSGNVHAFTIDIAAALDNNIAEVETDP